MFDEDEFTDDDEDDDIETPCYMGVAQVPLAPLSHGKPVSGTVQLKQVGMVYTDMCSANAGILV